MKQGRKMTKFEVRWKTLAHEAKRLPFPLIFSNRACLFNA